MLEYWCAPGRVSYTIPQILFILQNWELVQTGVWPPECRESAYSGGNGKSGHAAPFELVMSIVADLQLRLDRCGSDGKLLLKEAKLSDLSYPARLALRYCKGKEAKKTKYNIWKAVTKANDADYQRNMTLSNRMPTKPKCYPCNHEAKCWGCEDRAERTPEAGG